MLDISIIIVSWEVKDLLRVCLDSVLKNIKGLKYEIIVIDNGSRDSSQRLLRELKSRNEKLKIIFNKENLGFAKANNQGIKLAQGKYLLLLNPDTEVLAKSIERLIDFMEKNKEVGICAPKIINPDQSLQFSIGFFPTPVDIFLEYFFLLPIKKKLLKRKLERLHQESVEADFLLGACLFIRKEVFDKIGFLDEQFFLYSEEVDFCKRAKEAGFKIRYLPDIQVIHHLSKTTSQSADFKKRIQSRAYLQESHYKYFKKHFNSLSANSVKFMISFSLFLRWFVFKIRRPFLGQELKRELDLKTKSYQEVLKFLRRAQ